MSAGLSIRRNKVYFTVCVPLKYRYFISFSRFNITRMLSINSGILLTVAWIICNDVYRNMKLIFSLELATFEIPVLFSESDLMTRESDQIACMSTTSSTGCATIDSRADFAAHFQFGRTLYHHCYIFFKCLNY